VEEKYLLVKGDNLPSETAGQERARDLRSTLTAAERQGGKAKEMELVAGSPYAPGPSGEGLRNGPSYSKARSEETEGLELGAGSSCAAEPSGGGLRSRPTHNNAQAEEAKGPEGRQSSPCGLKALDDGLPSGPPYAAPQEVEWELMELSQQEEWGPPGATTHAASTGEPQPSQEKAADLTELSESSFRAGLSSGQKSS